MYYLINTLLNCNFNPDIYIIILEKYRKIINDILQNLFSGDPFKISNGMVKIEDTPGWGIEINPDWLDKSEYKKTEI